MLNSSHIGLTSIGSLPPTAARSTSRPYAAPDTKPATILTDLTIDSTTTTAAELSTTELATRVAEQLSFAIRPTRYVLEQVRRHNATVPFLARYRRDETGQLNEDGIHRVLATADELAEVHRRRQFMLKSLLQRQLLTKGLQAVLEQCTKLVALEDIWESFKERKTSLAARAREAGLGGWAQTLTQSPAALPPAAIHAISQLPDGERLFAAIVVEEVQRCNGLREALLHCCSQSARICSSTVTAARKKVAKELSEEAWDKVQKNFSYYDGKSWPVRHVESHVLLALLRGERKGVLRVEVSPAPQSRRCFDQQIRQHFAGLAARMSTFTTAINNSSSNNCTNRESRNLNSCSVSRGSKRLSVYSKEELDLSQQCLSAAYAQLLKSVHITTLRQLRKTAEDDAHNVFARNLQHMLLQRPLAQARILAMDPGLRNGVKCVALDENGSVLHTFVCTLMDERGMKGRVQQVVQTYHLNKIVIGNGTASQRTTELMAELVQLAELRHVEFTVVSEAGASVYSVSDIAKTEFPAMDAMYRGAVSIGRRVLDPLSEYVKIPVRSMGIGMYQHDMNEKDLMRTLSEVVKSCVAKVGINAESMNRYVVEKVPGVGARLADQIVLARHARTLSSREDLRKVPGMTESIFTYVAGFFRFPNSTEPLDNSFIHPESYSVVRRLLAMYQSGALSELVKSTTCRLNAMAISANTPDSATELPTAIVIPMQGGNEDRDTHTAKRAPCTTSRISSAMNHTNADSLSCTAEQRVALGRALVRMSTDALTSLAHNTLQCGVHALRFIAEELQHPGLDPRATLPHAGLLRRTLLKESELKRGDRLTGLVLSVTPFGAFVDCGLHHAVLVRGSATTHMQVGQLIVDQLIFRALDHLGRPQVVYDNYAADEKEQQQGRRQCEDGRSASGSGGANPLVAPNDTHGVSQRQRQQSTIRQRYNYCADNMVTQSINMSRSANANILMSDSQSDAGICVNRANAHVFDSPATLKSADEVTQVDQIIADLQNERLLIPELRKRRRESDDAATKRS